jgi:hypothetical protein
MIGLPRTRVAAYSNYQPRTSIDVENSEATHRLSQEIEAAKSQLERSHNFAFKADIGVIVAAGGSPGWALSLLFPWNFGW